MKPESNIGVLLVSSLKGNNVKRKSNSNSLDLQVSAQRVFQDYIRITEMEVVIVEDLVKPFLFLFKRFLPFHDTIKYDHVKGCCLLEKGSFIRKIICALWQILVLYRLVIETFPDDIFEESAANPEHPTKNVSPIGLGVDFIYITFTSVCFYVYWRKTSCICDIFNQIITLAVKLHLPQRSPSRIKSVKLAVHGSWIFGILYIIITSVLYTNQVLSSATISTNEETSPKQDLNASLKSAFKFQSDFMSIHACSNFTNLRKATAVAGFVNMFNWIMTMFHFGVWGLLFRQLFTIFYWRIQSQNEMEYNIVVSHEIRIFNEIGTIIDQMNKIYGLACVFGVVTCVAYISTSIKYVFSGISKLPDVGTGWHLVLSYFPMIMATILIAECNRLAMSFSGVIKQEFGRYTKKCGDMAECLCGIAIVHYDLITSNIGFKGFGFFTVSYQFVTTIVGAIISYSILMAQMFPQDNSYIEI